MTETPNSSSETPRLPTGPGARFTFIYYFSGTALITAFFTAKTLGIGYSTGLPGQVALIGGVIGGTLGVLFNRTESWEMPFSSRKRFTQQLQAAMAEMGYAHIETVDGVDRYQRSALGRFFSGDIFVQLQDQQAVFVSRISNIRSLRKRLG